MPAGIRYIFPPFELDPQSRRLARGAETLAIPERHFEVLHHLVANAGATVSKNALVEAVWADVAVTDNSLEQAISALRKVLGSTSDGSPYIATVPRQGYRFTAAVQRAAARASDASLDALLAPHRAWLEGRAALETLDRSRIAEASAAFAQVLGVVPEHAPAHVGMANACIMQFEATRVDAAPDKAALERAAHHAREACRLDPGYGEAWATLGFVLDRVGAHGDALAALRRALSLEPDNWRHQFRMAFVGWGEERLRAARRTLSLLPGFPLAYWMAATVHVARNVLEQAERELAAGITVQEQQGSVPFSAVGLHWLRGLVRLAQDDLDAAHAAFERELACEGTNHLYARECCANTWYAMGALLLRRDRLADARAALQHAIDRVPMHPPARVALAALSQAEGTPPSPFVPPAATVDAAIVRAIALGLGGDHEQAAQVVDEALIAAPPGSSGWLLPVEPLLHVSARPHTWAAALSRLRARAT